MKTFIRKLQDRKSPDSDDDFPEDLLIQVANLSLDEFGSTFDKDLLSGRDLIDLDDICEEDHICLDYFIASKMYSFYG